MGDSHVARLSLRGFRFLCRRGGGQCLCNKLAIQRSLMCPPAVLVAVIVCFFSGRPVALQQRTHDPYKLCCADIPPLHKVFAFSLGSLREGAPSETVEEPASRMKIAIIYNSRTLLSSPCGATPMFCLQNFAVACNKALT